MREIKFRAWRTRGREKGEMVYEPDIVGIYGIPTAGDSSDIMMQFTGLTDKSGKEIYEGDIVEYDTCGKPIKNYEVKFEGGRFGIDTGEFNLTDLTGASRGVEVIGNIYENPELLEG